MTGRPPADHFPNPARAQPLFHARQSGLGSRLWRRPRRHRFNVCQGTEWVEANFSQAHGHDGESRLRTGPFSCVWENSRVTRHAGHGACHCSIIPFFFVQGLGGEGWKKRRPRGWMGWRCEMGELRIREMEDGEWRCEMACSHPGGGGACPPAISPTAPRNNRAYLTTRLRTGGKGGNPKSVQASPLR